MTARLKTDHPTANEWAERAASAPSDVADIHPLEALKALRNELGAMVHSARAAMKEEYKRDLSIQEERIRLTDAFIALQTFHFLVKDTLNRHPENAHEIFATDWKEAPSGRRASAAIRSAYDAAKADARHVIGKPDDRQSRRTFLTGVAGLVAAGSTTYQYLQSGQTIAHSKAQPPIKQLGDNLTSAAAGMAGWHAGNLVSPLWEPLIHKIQPHLASVGLTENAMKALQQAIEQVVQEGRSNSHSDNPPARY